METPNWWEFLLLVLATFRVYRLVAEDTILDWPRNKLLRLSAGWRDEQAAARRVGVDYVPPPEYRAKWALFLTCPWCLGFWLSGLALALYCVATDWINVFSFAVVWLAISGAVGLVAKNLDQEEE